MARTARGSQTLYMTATGHEGPFLFTLLVRRSSLGRCSLGVFNGIAPSVEVDRGKIMEGL
jgi:hypothetical protein